MSQRSDEIKAGFMVAAGFILLGLFYFKVSGVSFSTADADEYTALFSYSAGIKRGTPVRFGGLQVGEVTEVRFMDETAPVPPEADSTSPQNRIKVVFQVARGTPVLSDSDVRIAQLSMLGDYHLEVTTGTLAGQRVSPPHQFDGQEPVDLFGAVAELTGQMEPILASVNRILTDDVAALRARMGGVFDKIDSLLVSANDVLNDENRENISTTLRELRGTLQDNRPDIRTTVQNVRDASQRLQTVMTDVQAIVGDARPEVQAILSELRDTVSKADALMENLDGMVTENRPAINEMVSNMNATAANARDLTETLSEEPWRLIWRSADHQAAVPTARAGS